MRHQRLLQAVLAGGMSAFAVGGFAPTIANAASNNDTLTVAGGSSYTYTFNQSPSIQATAQPNCATLSGPGQVTLTISGPAVTSSTLVSHRGDCGKALSVSPSSSAVNTRHPAWTGGTTAASNGVYTVTLNNQGRTKTATFTLLIPPAKPTGFNVTPNSPTSATFTWAANSEPDITGYQITNAAGNVVAEPSSSACSGGSCSSGETDLGSSVSGHSERYSITAIRSCGNASCSAGHVASSSASGSTTFPAAPTPTPTPTPTKSSGGSNGGGGDNGGGNGNGNGGGTSLGTVTGDGGGTGGNNGGHGNVDLGNADSAGQVSHNLPPVSVGALPPVNAPDLPSVRTSIRPLDPGAPPGKINYPAPLLAKQQADKGLAHDLQSAVSWKPLWRGIAAAAVLLLIAVHLRAWVARTEAF